MVEKFVNSNNSLEKKEKIDVRLEIADENDWKDYKKIRLEALENEPMAFWATKKKIEEEYNKTEQVWKNELSSEDMFTAVIKNNQDPIGMAQAFLRNEQNNLWHIREVYLNKNFRGQGYGNKIMNFIINEIKNRNGKGVTLNVTDTQEIAEKIYKELGFKTYKTFKPATIDNVEMPGGKWMFKEL